MSVLLISEHNNKNLKPFTLNAITAASKIDSDLHVLVAGHNCADVAKAVSNLLTNEGKAENYQGWDLLEKKGVFSIGIPSLSGTGSESSRTCVLLNTKKNLKLGFNSKFTCFDNSLEYI